MSGNGKPRNTVQPAWLTGDGGAENVNSVDSAPVKKPSFAPVVKGEVAPVKSESSQPKFEPKKPMFVPKVPVKKEVPVASTASTSTAQNTETNKSDYKGDRNKKNNNGKSFTVNKFTPKGKSVGFSEGQHQSRKWVMPVGAAFFTGTNGVGSSAGSSASSNKAAFAAVPVAKGPVLNAAGNTRIMRPNEKIEEVPVQRVVKSTSNTSFVSYQSAPESDSDEEDGDGGDNHEDSNLMTNEVWPPMDYDPLAPLALPLGPRSNAMRSQLAAEPILADPMDEEALDREQNSNLFVLQMPSDLKFDKIAAANNKDLAAGGELQNGNVRIGKMQLLASGKVRLVALDGKVYEVNSGMASSFVQILASMDVPIGDVVKSAAENALGHAHEGASSSSTAAAGGNGRAAKGASTAASMGLRDAATERSVMDLMGSVTKKLVITPAHEIGARRQRSYSINTPAAKGPGEFMYAMSQQAASGRGYGEEEEIVMDT